MGATVEAHIYSSANPVAVTMDATVDVEVAAVVYTSTAPGPLSFSDLLAYWSTDLSTQTSETVLFAYDATTDRVTVTCTDTLDLTLTGATAPLLGFTSLSYTGTTITAESGPGAIVPLVSAAMDPPRMIDRAELTRYRHGQALATTWTQIRVQTVELVARGAEADRLTAWVTSGFVTVTDSEGVAVSGFVVDEPEFRTEGQREQITIRRLVLVLAEAATVEAGPYTGVWGALAFGWSVVYGLTVDGIPSLFVERQAGDVTGEGALSIDDSADIGVEIDRERGLGAGLALSVTLRDTSTVRGYMRNPSLIARLTAPYASDAPTINVDDTTGWPAPGSLYLGHERFSYTGTTGTTFTGANRTSSSIQRIYESAAGYVCTDRPYQWRGRRCNLQAFPVNPYGWAQSEGVTVFYGELEAEPLRKRDGFALTAQSLDRVLEREIVGVSTGTVESQDGCVAYPDLTLSLTIKGKHNSGASGFSYSFQVSPFTALTGPTVLDWSSFAQQLRDEWYAVVSALVGNTYIDTYPTLEPIGPAGFQLRIPLLYDGNFHVYRYSASWSGGGVNSASGLTPWENMPHNYGVNEALTTQAVVQWYDGDLRRANVIGTSTWPVQTGAEPSPACFVRLETPTFTTVTECKFKVGDNYTKKAVCESVLLDDGRVFLYGIKAKYGGAIPANLIGATVTLGAALTGSNLVNLAYPILMSSGSGDNGTEDTLSQSQGYAIPEALLVWSGAFGGNDPGTLDGLVDDAIATLSALPERISLADFLGGLLALRRQAIALAPYGTGMRLQLVSTGPGASDWVAHVTDDDLVGYAEDPAETTERLRPPNRVTLQAGDDIEPVTVQDLSSVAIEGPNEWTLTVPVGDRDSLVALALAYGQSLLTLDRSGQAATLRLPPWLTCKVGDSLSLDVSHPSLWSPQTGLPGYTGFARISGLLRNLRTGVQKATLLLSGNQTVAAISPAWRVTSWVGADNNPTTIDIDQPTDLGYGLGVELLAYVDNMIAQSGSPVALLHYEPGVSEGVGQLVYVTAAAILTGGIRLAVSSVTGVTLTADSWLTLPDLTSAEGSAWQDGHAHVDDGTYWEG